MSERKKIYYFTYAGAKEEQIKQEGKNQGKEMREKKGDYKIGLCDVFRIGK